MVKTTSRACFLALSTVLMSTAAAQTTPVVLSIDRFLSHPSSGESRHEILPVAVFDGTRFQSVREADPVLGESSGAQYLLARYPIVEILHYGEPIGTVTVSDIRAQRFQCSSLIMGTGDYATSVTVPKSEISSLTRRRENGDSIEYATETFLALAHAADDNDRDGGPVITAVTETGELERYATEVDRIAPRPELLPLGIDETHAYELNGQNGALVVRKRQIAGTVAGPGTARIEGTLFTDVVVVRAGPGRSAIFPLVRAERNGLGGGADLRFIDAFSLRNGTVYLAFERRFSEAVDFLLYQLGAINDTRLVVEASLHGC